MKCFETKTQYGSEKVNFIDERNVCVGYEMAQQCCEDFGWFVSQHLQSRIGDNPQSEDREWPGFIFDVTRGVVDMRQTPDEYDYAGIVAFRLIKGDHDEEEMWLHLYNLHNGYYSHGYDFSRDGETISEGVI